VAGRRIAVRALTTRGAWRHAARTPAGRRRGRSLSPSRLTNACGGAGIRTSSNDLRTRAVSVPGSGRVRVHGPQVGCATAVEIRSRSYRAGDPACRRRCARARIRQSGGPLAFAPRRDAARPRHR
jgi:hypothetical protein